MCCLSVVFRISETLASVHHISHGATLFGWLSDFAKANPPAVKNRYFFPATRSLASSNACCIACHIFSSDWVPSIFTILALG